MWHYAHTENTTATAAQLWRHYARPEDWPQWDADAASVTFTGAFDVGASGTITPTTGPKAGFTLTEVTEPLSFTSTTALPLARLAFAHVVEPGPEGCAFTHAVTITGPLSWLFGIVIGRPTRAGMPTAMRTLARLAETSDLPVAEQ